MPTPASTAALGILLILLPGFACSFMVQQLTVKAKQTEFDKLVEALLFSFILYLGTLPFFGSSLPLAWTESKQQGFTSYTIHLHWGQLFALGISAILLALLYAVNSKYDLFHRMLRKLRLTERTSRVSVWNDAFQDIQSRYLLVELKDGRRLLGYPRYYADDVDQSSLFLEDAAWMGVDGEQYAIDGPGILLTKEAGLLTIAFLDAVDQMAPPT